MTGQFQKGMIPWNKGKPHPAGRNWTNFKPGHRPQTWRPIGSESVDKDGIRWVKISDTGVKRRDWKAEHVLVWAWFHARKLPRGWIVVFTDRDRTNFAPDNLLAINRADNMRRNSYHRYPQPIPQLIQLRGALQRQINRRDKHGQGDRGSEGTPFRGAGRAERQAKPDGHRAGSGDRGRISRDRG